MLVASGDAVDGKWRQAFIFFFLATRPTRIRTLTLTEPLSTYALQSASHSPLVRRGHVSKVDRQDFKLPGFGEVPLQQELVPTRRVSVDETGMMRNEPDVIERAMLLGVDALEASPATTSP